MCWTLSGTINITVPTMQLSRSHSCATQATCKHSSLSDPNAQFDVLDFLILRKQLWWHNALIEKCLCVINIISTRVNIHLALGPDRITQRRHLICTRLVSCSRYSAEHLWHHVVWNNPLSELFVCYNSLQERFAWRFYFSVFLSCNHDTRSKTAF